jgi:iron complex outermembrane receptor protein
LSRSRGLGSSFRSHLASSLSAAVLAIAAPALAANERQIDLPAGALQRSLAALADETGEQLVFAPALVADRKVPALSGRYDVDTALARLLAGTDIEATRAGPRLIVLRRRGEPAPSAAPVPTSRGEDSSRKVAGPTDQAPATAGTSQTAPIGKPATNTVEAIEVTGTHIRGGGPSASPITTLDRSDFDRLGQMTISAGLSSVPQNFNGLDTEVSNVTRADGHGVNGAFATGVNLRGLGSNATLVLVDGRRLGGAGAKGDFTDISTLPNIAVDRVDLLLDGASAIYGSDAVGGVVNVRMRNVLDGGEVRIEGGQATRGGPNEGQLGLIFGHTWTDGGIVGAYEVYHRIHLSDADRDFAASPDLRPFGGSDFRTPFNHPGTILGATVGGVATQSFAIPAGQNGLTLTPASFTPGVNLGNSHSGADLLPDQERQSAYVSAHQTVGSVTFAADAIHGFRAARFTLSPPSSAFTVSTANPFFVSPTGAKSETIEYSFTGDLPAPVSRGTEENLAVTLDARANLGRRWQSDSFIDFAQDIEESHTFGMANSAILAEALGNVPDRPTTTYSPARDGFFNPFTGIVANTPAVLAAIGSGFSVTRGVDRVYTASTQADGPLFDLPAGPLSLAIGGQVRRETFVRGGSNYTSTVAPTPINGTDASRTVAGLYGELRAPLFGPDNARPGLQRLELAAALRWEHYSDFGGTADPKIGVLWSPVEDLQARVTYGRSFRAPGLRELKDPGLNTPVFSSANGVRVFSLLLTGGNPNLRPETANTWTAGVDWRPSQAPGLLVSMTFFDVAYRNRIDQPVITETAIALGDPALASFVRRLTPGNASDLAAITALLASPATSTAQGSFPASMYGAILDGRYVNTGALEVRGLDLTIRYSFDLAGGRLDLSGTGSDLLTYKQQVTPMGSFVERVGQVDFPVRLRARLNADWSRGALSLGASVSHASGEHDMTGAKLDDQTTLDLRLRWTAPQTSRWRGVSFGVTARNVFDEQPAFYNNPLGFGIDGANADVIGRFISVQLSKSW